MKDLVEKIRNVYAVSSGEGTTFWNIYDPELECQTGIRQYLPFDRRPIVYKGKEVAMLNDKLNKDKNELIESKVILIDPLDGEVTEEVIKY